MLRAARRPLRRAFAAAALFAAAGCGGDPTSSNTLVGTYTLRTVNGATVPTSISIEGLGTVTVRAGQLTVRDQSRWALTLTGQGNAVFTDEGTYTVSGTSVQFTSTEYDDAFGGTASSDRRTITAEYDLSGGGDVFTGVFTR